jgi:urease subunit alpha
VLWRPAFFGVVPHLVLKGGFPVWGARGSAYASTRIGEPVVQGPLWGSLGAAPEQLAAVYTSAAGAGRVRERRRGRVGVVRGTRAVRKAHLVHNGATPRVEVDGARREVRVDGAPVALQPVGDLPLNAAYTLA